VLAAGILASPAGCCRIFARSANGPSSLNSEFPDNFRFLAPWAMAVRRELGGGYLAGLVRFLVIWQSGGLKGWAAVDPVAGQPHRSFRGLLEHLATLTRNQVRFAGTTATIPMLTEPTSTQRQAFDLLGVPIPLTLK